MLTTKVRFFPWKVALLSFSHNTAAEEDPLPFCIMSNWSHVSKTPVFSFKSYATNVKSLHLSSLRPPPPPPPLPPPLPAVKPKCLVSLTFPQSLLQKVMLGLEFNYEIAAVQVFFVFLQRQNQIKQRRQRKKEGVRAGLVLGYALRLSSILSLIWYTTVQYSIHSSYLSWSLTVK